MLAMCDYMYYEHKQRSKAKLPEAEPELEKAEERPVIVKV